MAALKTVFSYLTGYHKNRQKTSKNTMLLDQAT